MKDEKKVSISRKNFLKKGALIGGTSLTGVLFGKNAAAQAQNKILKSNRPDAEYQLNKPENIIHSVCLNCNTGCGIKAKIQDGVLVKIDGSPYNPWTMVPHIPYETSLKEASKIDGGLCPKGQAGVQIAYDPYRIKKVLKRTGKRGEDKWETIPFDQAIEEIVEGGKLFSHVEGEENREVEGLRSIMALKDPEVSKKMKAEVEKIWASKDEAEKAQRVSEFKSNFADHLDTLIDPDHPDLGPKNNQMVVTWGRLKGGRKEFFQRFGKGFGTTNLHGHTTVCQGSLYFACKAINEKYQQGEFSGSKKMYWQTELEHARYVLFVGANLFEGNYGPTNRTVRLTKNLSSGYTKIGVVDPRFSKLASKADTWLPIKPGMDAALAMAIIQWMIQNERYDESFLKNANRAAADSKDEPSFSNATHLVEILDDGPGAFVRAADFGIRNPETRTKDGETYTEKFLTVLVDGKPVAIDPDDKNSVVYGDLFVDTELTKPNGEKVRVKSALQLLKESAEEHTIEEWCDMAGLQSDKVKKVAKELTSYGKQASVDIHRGVAQHTNGFYNVFAWMSINMLLGNYDYAGGMSLYSKYKYDGGDGGAFDLSYMQESLTPFGISSIRHDIDYEKTTIFDGYPAKRNWYPLSSDVYEEVIPSAGDQYPYPVKALLMYMGSPVYALPGGHTNIDVLADVEKLPLVICSDILVGTSSMYSDYIFPDLTYMERWEFQGSHPNMPNKVENVRQPVMSPIPETVTVYGEEMPISIEALYMAIAERLELKTFGKDALGPGKDFNRPEDFYLRAVANLGTTDNGVPDANDFELEVFTQARRHLDKSVFDEQVWKNIVGEDYWRKMVYVLNRGGRFENHSETFKDGKLAHPYGRMLNLYQEKTALNKYSGTGKRYSGIAGYIPQSNYEGQLLDSMGDGYELNLITHRTITQTKSRTIAAYWLQPMKPENGISINPKDAERMGLKKDDRVKVVSSTNKEGVWDLKNGRKKEMIGKVIPTQTMRPGVISFELGFGHWATGSTDINVDGKVVKGDPRRSRGIHANAAMWTDPTLRNNTCLIDPVGGSVSFYDTKVNLVKV
ncbi:molybdopterin-dependent oxidoreductase [Rhodohalobacter sp.]|uniref:molybdopterin-dependent oxidoreductase n=1 Tax=Rhodohalobacter sp. TaxID=1974210 RepID=UPI002ACD262B|nr:molybdopterin-dependent oxidoreductase [Rhodohalobacter sp.]MDZ7756814.1 molybdopterin-dependent oxidoreductase [Rhodohalobacter sp.]